VVIWKKVGHVYLESTADINFSSHKNSKAEDPKHHQNPLFTKLI